MNKKPLCNKAIDYLIVCKDEDRATRLFERFCEMLDGTHSWYKTLKDRLCVLMVGSSSEYRFITEDEKELFNNGFRKVIDEHYFETLIENYEQY